MAPTAFETIREALADAATLGKSARLRFDRTATSITTVQAMQVQLHLEAVTELLQPFFLLLQVTEAPLHKVVAHHG